MSNTFQGLIAEGVSSDAKKFMKELNSELKFLKEDVKTSETNHDWYNRLESIQILIKKELGKR